MLSTTVGMATKSCAFFTDGVTEEAHYNSDQVDLGCFE